MQTSNGLHLSARKPPNSSDLETLNQVWGRKEYQMALDLLRRDQPGKNNVTIIDAGANVGFSTLQFKSEFPDARIISIEPDPGNFAQLTSNTTSPRCNGVTLIQAGLWHRQANLKITQSNFDGREWAFQVEEVTDNAGIPAVSLQDIIQEHQISQIDLLKIDIEGSERYLFDDEKKAAEFLRLSRIVAIEIHDYAASRPHILKVLEQSGFTHFSHSDLTICYRA
jgi:FkbM family methyltransferase